MVRTTSGPPQTGRPARDGHAAATAAFADEGLDVRAPLAAFLLAIPPGEGHLEAARVGE